jgi:glutamate 5-kinase
MPTTLSRTGSGRAAKPIYRRVVVKAGSALLTHGGDRVSDSVIDSLASQIASLHAEGMEVVLVSSGATAAGRTAVAVPEKGLNVPIKQVLAAVGQGLLMHRYEQAFGGHDVRVAQALLTGHDLEGRLAYLNVRNTLLKLLEIGVVPIVNENDVVNVEQLSERAIGDNDTLSALVANLVDADLLVILGELNGLYTTDPHIDPSAEPIPEVTAIDDDILAMGGESFAAGGVAVGYGGMAAKLQAAKLVTASGTAAVMASGLEPDVLVRLAHGERVGTYFAATGSHMESRKRWMLSDVGARGEVVVDEGAVTALTTGKRSLLPAGITGVRGHFNRGDVVTVLTSSGDGIATGIANYDSIDIDRIKGVRSSRIAEVLGHEYGEEVIHRSNLVRL